MAFAGFVVPAQNLGARLSRHNYKGYKNIMFIAPAMRINTLVGLIFWT